jgi:hypothetical protein
LFVGWLQPKSELLYVTSFLLCRSAHHHPLSQQLLLPDVNCRDIVRCDDDDDDDDDLRPGGGGVSGCEKRPPHQQDQQLQASSTKSKTIRRHTHRERKTATKEKETRDPAGSQEWVPSRKPSQRTTLHKTTTAKLSQQESSKQSKQAHNPSELFLLFFQGNT